MDWPAQTVVIPIRNEVRYIESTIKYILRQDYPPDKLEVIVVDGDSDDGTATVVQSICRADPRVKQLHNPARLSSAARNIGAREARGEIITFIDGHTYISNDQLLKSVAGLMTEKDVSVLSRPQFLETPDNDLFQKAVALARKSVFGHGLDSTIYSVEDKYVDPTSAGASYKKEIFETVGYFDESFDAAEDVEFNYRVHRKGYRSFSSLSLAVYYYPRDSFSKLFRQMMRYGIGRFRFVRKHPEALSAAMLLPTALVLGLPILLLLSLFWTKGIWILVILYGAYALMNIASTLRIVISNGLGYFRLLPAIYLTVHCGLGWGFLTEFIRTAAGSRRPASH